MADRMSKRARMSALIKEWRRSGESMAGFGRRHGIDPQKLSYWRAALEGSGASARTAGRKRAVRTGFVPVRIMPGVPGAGGVEIVVGDCRVVVREGVSRELLGEVIAAVRRSC
jgi:hypothetical protein